MSKRTREETKDLRALLIPGACFAHAGSGSVGKVVSRTATEDGVVVRCSYATRSCVRENATDLRTLTSHVTGIVDASVYDAAVARLREAKAARKPEQVPRLLVREERIAGLEERVRYLEEVVAYIERATNVRPFRKFNAAE